MADEVKIIGIDTSIRREIDWAKEATLSRLVSAANDQVSLLETLAKVKAVELRKIKEADAGFAQVGNAAGQAADAMKKGAADRKKTDRELNESIRDLRWSMSRHGSQISSLLTRSTNPMTRLPSAIESTTDWLAKFAKGNKVATVAVMAIGTAIAKLAERFIEAAESYRGMMQSGVMFNGSVSTMIQNVRSAGVGIEAASQVIDQYSQAILSVGESKFFKNIEDSTKIFARLGMTQEQGMRTFAELEEMRRLSGLSYMQSEEERTRSNEQLVQLMQSQSILTGVSIKRQKEAAQKAAVSERVRFMQAQLSPEQLAAQEVARTKMASMGMSGDLIEGVLLEAMSGATNQFTAAARQTMGPAFEDILQAVRAGTPEAIGSLEQREALGRYSQEFMQRAGPGMALSQGPMQRLMVSQALESRDVNFPTFQARPGQETELERRRRMAERAARGEQIVDNTTQAYFQTVNNTAVALGRVEALAFRLADPVISGLIQSLSLLSGAVNNVVGGAAGLSDTTLYGGLATGAAGMYMMKRMFSGGTGMPAMPQMFGPPAPPALAGAAGAGARTLGPMAGGLARGLGIFGGLAGTGYGAYTAATGATREERQMGILAAMGGGALTGGTIGAGLGMGVFSLPGALAGAAIGAGTAGIAALAANLYGTRGAAASEPAGMGGDFSAGLTGLNATIARGNSEIVFWLKSIDSKMNSVDTGVRRAGGAIVAMGG